MTWTPLDDPLSASDLVVGFVPGIPESKDLLGARELGLMKRSAHLINCGRALSVNEPALIDALRSGQMPAQASTSSQSNRCHDPARCER